MSPDQESRRGRLRGPSRYGTTRNSDRCVEIRTPGACPGIARRRIYLESNGFFCLSFFFIIEVKERGLKLYKELIFTKKIKFFSIGDYYIGFLSQKSFLFNNDQNGYIIYLLIINAIK